MNTFRSCCAVVWPGLEKVVWRGICEEEPFDLRSGNTLSLAAQTQTFRLKGGTVSIPSRTQLSELHTHLDGGGGGGGFMCYLWYLQKFPSLPRLHHMRRGILTTRKEWRFKRQEFQARSGRMAAFEASSLLLKAEWGGEGEKNQC